MSTKPPIYEQLSLLPGEQTEPKPFNAEEYYKSVANDASIQFHELQIAFNKVRIDYMNEKERAEASKEANILLSFEVKDLNKIIERKNIELSCAEKVIDELKQLLDSKKA